MESQWSSLGKWLHSHWGYLHRGREKWMPSDRKQNHDYEVLQNRINVPVLPLGSNLNQESLNEISRKIASHLTIHYSMNTFLYRG